MTKLDRVIFAELTKKNLPRGRWRELTKQEIFMFKMRELLPKVSMYGAGAIFQWTAGRVKRAPLAWQKLGLEWFWRLINDPIRLWRRYLIDNTLFLLLFTKQYLKSTKFSEPLKR